MGSVQMFPFWGITALKQTGGCERHNWRGRNKKGREPTAGGH